MNVAPHRYCVYGIVVVSDTALALPEYSDGGLGQVECRSAAAPVFLAAAQRARFDPASDSWYRYASLEDGSTYVRWDTVGEFLVAADGRCITSRRVDGASVESFHVYMLGQALSFALVKQGFEPLHATVVVVDDRAVALLGENGSGKSSLAASFVEAGWRLLTDDLLLVREHSGRLLAYPGPARIKLFPQIAGRFLGAVAERVPMNPDTQKLILPIGDDRSCTEPAPLDAIYSLAPPRDVGRNDPVSIDALSPRAAFVELVRSTFNRRLVDADRLTRQFETATNLTRLVSIKKIRYPRRLERLPEVRDLIVADLARGARSLECARC